MILGERLQCVGFSLRGAFTEENAWTLLRAVIEAMGMTESPGAVICRYPLDGLGGVGFTIFQPITESFLGLDVWPDLGGGYLIICSCKPFGAYPVIQTIEEHEFRIGQVFNESLRIPGDDVS